MEMKIKITAALIALFVVGVSAPAFANGATKDEAVAMVSKAAAYVKEVGPEKAYTEFSVKGGKWTDRDLYVVVYKIDGTVLAHGSNIKLVGKHLMDVQDVDGVYYIKDRMALAAKKADFWQGYKFVNPVTKKVEPKQMFCHPVDDIAICAGVYE
jgi:signal transduction histidine kinase